MKRARAIPKVKVYSRHRPDCRWAGDDTKVSCDCPKQLSWYRNGKLYRKTADTADAEVADRRARDLENSFEAAATGKVVEQITGKLLDEAVAEFLTSKAHSGVTEKHLAKLKFELEEFARFVLSKGLVNLGDIATENVLAYRNSLVGAQNTRAKKIFRLIGFFEFCVEMGWLTRNVSRAKSVKLKYSDSQTPKALTDAQFEQLLAAVPKMNGRVTDEQKRKLRSLVLLMRWTGLAIRDAVTIERSRFDKNGGGFYNLLLYRAKTGHPVYSTLKAEIVQQILAGAKKDGRWLFVDDVPKTERGLDNLIKGWGVLFSKLGDAAALKDEQGQPYGFSSHSLRHSFVFWALNNNLPTEDVAMLIGDSVEIVARHYSAWIAGRQERLNERMIEALK